MTETVVTVAELARRMDEAGFGRLAAAVRAAAEGTLVGLLAAPPALPPRRGGKPSA